MMDIRALQAFERPIRDHRVLSVYLDGEAGDPGVRDQWRIRCKAAQSPIRHCNSSPARATGPGRSLPSTAVRASMGASSK